MRRPVSGVHHVVYSRIHFAIRRRDIEVANALVDVGVWRVVGLRQVARSEKRLAHVLQEVKKATVEGISTGELDQLAHKLITDMGDTAPFFNYQPAGAQKPSHAGQP